MRRCLLRWQTETSGDAFSRFWQYFLGVSFKDRFRRHLTTYCEVRCNSLTPKISRLLPGSGGVVDQRHWRKEVKHHGCRGEGSQTSVAGYLLVMITKIE